jgi:SAM-dependent methyltransferase
VDRATWLAERRAAVTAAYNAEASEYDEHEYPSDMQRDWIQRLVHRLPADSLVLDAPCRTGKYFPIVAAAGQRVVGVDQSPGMPEQARARTIAIALECTSLRDLTFQQEFDAVLTVDAMENVPPEEWPLVLRNLHRSLHPGGLLYVTVEEVDESTIDAAFASLSRSQLPAVRGEVTEGDVAGYHFYPGRQQVLTWFGAEDLEVLDEAYNEEDGWGYRHFLLRDTLSAKLVAAERHSTL